VGRHLTTAQKAEIVLKLAEIEAEKARKRLSEAGRIGAQITNTKLGRGTGQGHGPRLEENDKGKSIELAVKRARALRHFSSSDHDERRLNLVFDAFNELIYEF